MHVMMIVADRATARTAGYPACLPPLPSGRIEGDTMDKRYTHGMSGTRVLRIYRGIIQRCTNPNQPHYERYGGRGVTICDAWRKSFEAFYADMGDPPTDQHSIDRIDNDRGYEPGNCRWATIEEQNANRRPREPICGEANNKAKLTADIVRQIRASSDTGADLSRRYGVSQTAIGYIRRRRTWKHIA